MKRQSLIKKLYARGRGTFEVIIGSKSGDTTGALYGLFVTAIFLIVFVLSLNLLINNPTTLGPWGDFFGGVLNPLLTFLTFIGLLITIVLQQTELRDARKEFERSADALQNQNKATNRQIFESTFFQMLSLHNTIVNAITVEQNEDRISGRDCFHTFYNDLRRNYRSLLPRKGQPGLEGEGNIIETSFASFWQHRQQSLGHYYRYLYNIVRFVDESEYRDGPYMRLVRSQLSDKETLLLFYNCLTDQGRKFRELAERFSLFDNIDTADLLHQDHTSLMGASAFGHR